MNRKTIILFIAAAALALAGCATQQPTPGEAAVNEILSRHSPDGRAVDVRALSPAERAVLKAYRHADSDE